MMLFFVFLLVCLLNCSFSNRVDYCRAKMCGRSDEHTFCQFSAGPSEQCSGYIDATLSDEEKNNIVERLNKRRNQAALGQLSDYPSATNMLKLSWVEELAREAQLWSDQCTPPQLPEVRDKCRDLYSITVGQCVASVVGEAPGLRPETMVDIWYLQHANYRGNVSQYIPPESSESQKNYEDFAQITYARAFMVGCGRSKFVAKVRGRDRNVERLVCNFAPRGPLDARPIWLPGTPASSCPLRSVPDKQMPALCSLQLNTTELLLERERVSSETYALLMTLRENYFNKSFDESEYFKKLKIDTIEEIMPYIAEVDDIIDKKNIDVIVVKDIITPEKLNRSRKMIINDSNTTILSQISTVGRPKAYIIEELDDNVYSKSSDYKQMEELNTTEKDEYIGYSNSDLLYNFDDVMPEIQKDEDDYELSHSEDKEPKLTATNVVTESIIESELTKEINTAELSTAVAIIEYNTQSLTHHTVNNDSIIEEYLSDSGTLQKLQDTLYQMELETAGTTETQKNSNKVRRELRDVEAADDENEDSPQENELLPQRQPTRKSIKDQPTLNSLVSKYLTYLKQYPRIILGHSSNNSSCLIPFTLILAVMSSSLTLTICA